jgi:hypothetical protein
MPSIMQSGSARFDPFARPYEKGSDVKVRPSLFPEPQQAPGRHAKKVRPLDFLSSLERWAVSYLDKGGGEPGHARAIAVGKSSWLYRPGEVDAFAYQVWLFDHRPQQ